MLVNESRILKEAEGSKEISHTFMTDEEQKWQKRLISMLINKDGRWGPFKHAKYAQRFSKFIFKIVSAKEDPNFTAAVDFEGSTIYISSGFLQDPAKFYQLNVLLRHELSHILLRHELRMAEKLGKIPYSKISTNRSLHDIINIIADYEISNKKYTEEDKKIVKNMFLNGKEISGLVTEMDRADWQKLSLEQMFEESKHDLAQLKIDMKDSRKKADKYGLTQKDDWKRFFRDTDSYQKLTKDSSGNSRKSVMGDDGKMHQTQDSIIGTGLAIYAIYDNKTDPSIIWKPIEEYLKSSKVFKALPKVYQDIIKETYNGYKDSSETELKENLNVITESEPFEYLTDPKIPEIILVTPEEKYFAAQVFKNLLGNAPDKPKTKVTKEEHSKEYKDAYNQIIDLCGKGDDCSIEEIKELLGVNEGTSLKGIE
jgi:hypothetical protein